MRALGPGAAWEEAAGERRAQDDASREGKERESGAQRAVAKDALKEVRQEKECTEESDTHQERGQE